MRITIYPKQPMFRPVFPYLPQVIHNSLCFLTISTSYPRFTLLSHSDKNKLTGLHDSRARVLAILTVLISRVYRLSANTLDI